MALGWQACPASYSTGNIYCFTFLTVVLTSFFKISHLLVSLRCFNCKEHDAYISSSLTHSLQRMNLPTASTWVGIFTSVLLMWHLSAKKEIKLPGTVVTQDFNKTEAHPPCWKHLGRVFSELGNMNKPFPIFLLGMFSSRQLFALLQAWSNFHWSPWKVSHCFIVTRAGPSMLQKDWKQR